MALIRKTVLSALLGTGFTLTVTMEDRTNTMLRIQRQEEPDSEPFLQIPITNGTVKDLSDLFSTLARDLGIED